MRKHEWQSAWDAKTVNVLNFLIFRQRHLLFLLPSFLLKWYFIHHLTHLWVHCLRLGCRDGLGPMRCDSDDHCELWKEKKYVNLKLNFKVVEMFTPKVYKNLGIPHHHLPLSMLRVSSRSSAVLVMSREWGFADTGRPTRWILSVPKKIDH